MFLPKWVFFAWEASWEKFLTLDQLKRRGWTLANRCFFCLVEEESTNHILIHCTKTRVLWELLFTLFGVTWVLPYSVRETLFCWLGSFVGKKRKKAWKLALLCLFWAVWKERNRIAFNNEEFSVHRLKYSFVCNLWSWTKLYIDVGPLSLIDFFDWLEFGANGWGFLCSLLFFALFSILAPVVYFLYALGCPPGFLFLINIFSFVFTHQKKN